MTGVQTCALPILSQLSEEFAEDGNFSETTKLQIRKDMFSLESKLPHRGIICYLLLIIYWTLRELNRKS